jgi:hypothetical protein
MMVRDETTESPVGTRLADAADSVSHPAASGFPTDVIGSRHADDRIVAPSHILQLSTVRFIWDVLSKPPRTSRVQGSNRSHVKVSP